MIGCLRGFSRSTLLLLWIFFVAGTLSILALLGVKHNKSIRFFFKGACFILGLDLKLEGTISNKKPLMAIANHVSYLDIFVMGAFLNPSFIAKSEMAKWPIIGFLTGKVGGNYFVDRRPSQALKEKERLDKAFQTLKRPMMFFPEATTSDGGKLLPFKPTMFDIPLGRDVYIQPFVQKYTHSGCKELKTKEDRTIYAWYDDDTYTAPNLLSHFWQMVKQPRATIVLKALEPIHAKDFTDRKELASAAQDIMEKNF